jgi:hypothetical protein
VIAFVGGELEGVDSAARRICPEQSPAISVNVQPTVRTFRNQCHALQLVIRFAIRRVTNKTKNTFQYKSNKNQNAVAPQACAINFR